MNDNRTNSAQWWAIGILAILVLCLGCSSIGLFSTLMSGPIQNPFMTRPLWNVPTTQATATPAIPASTQADVPTNAPTNTPTLAPAAADSTLVYLVGGVTRNDIGYETIAKTTLTYIAEETPLQMYFSQLVPQGFPNTYAIGANEEILNDGGVQWLVFQREGTWRVIEVTRDFGITENFSQISCIRFTNWSLTVWLHDDGLPGTWTGNCAGTNQVLFETATLQQMKSNAEFEPYYPALLRAMEDTSEPFNRKIEIVEVFKK